MLPAVSIALLAGAAFVVIAWAETEDAVQSAQSKDEVRAERLASSVDRVIERRAQDLQRWSEVNRELVDPARQVDLSRSLGATVEGGTASSASTALLVVRDDGSVLGAGESTPGQLAASGVADDLRALGRAAAVRDTVQVSDRLKLGDEYVYAVAVPVAAAESAPDVDAAIVAVAPLEPSSLGSFLTDDGAGAVDEASLRDSDNRVLVGAQVDANADTVERPVGDTGWRVTFAREQLDPFLPGWAYPMFALLLGAFAIVYAAQDIRQRHLRRRYDQRARTVQSLYELASRVLHAETIQQQADDLARAALDLADVDGARVIVRASDELVEGTAGITEPGADEYHVPIEGPRGDVGELVVWRADQPFEEDEGWVLQTASTLVGAALDTRVSLERERAVAAELQRLDELRSNLLATVAHELLSPLTAVKGVLGLLAMQDDLGARGREFVDVATERTDRLVALIRDLFDCSLLETGQLDIKPKRQRADELLDAALGAQAASRPGELRLSATPNLMITVDPVRFDQLVNNLVTNAFRHGAPPVEVAVRPGDGGAIVMVSDEGAGIAPEDRDEVFGKFWQGSSGHARIAEGAGLGLSLVQGLVRVHGGDIRIDSTHSDGRGARFIAFFPDDVAVAQPVTIDDASDAAPSLV
jgi:signal transduction histidine kinase